MNIVKVDPIDRWGWECPECQEWHETEDDPSYQETVSCDKCQAEFEPEVEI